MENNTEGKKSVISPELDSVATAASILHQSSGGKSVTVRQGDISVTIENGLSTEDRAGFMKRFDTMMEKLPDIFKGMVPTSNPNLVPPTPSSDDAVLHFPHGVRSGNPECPV